MDYTAHEYLYMHRKYLTIPWLFLDKVEDQNLYMDYSLIFMRSRYSVGFPQHILFEQKYCVNRYFNWICNAVTLDEKLKPRCCDRSHFIQRNMFPSLFKAVQLLGITWPPLIWMCQTDKCVHGCTGFKSGTSNINLIIVDHSRMILEWPLDL